MNDLALTERVSHELPFVSETQDHLTISNSYKRTLAKPLS